MFFICQKKLDNGYSLIYLVDVMKNETKAIFSRFDLSLYYKIKELSEKESRTVASVIRQAVKEFFERRETKTREKSL